MKSRYLLSISFTILITVLVVFHQSGVSRSESEVLIENAAFAAIEEFYVPHIQAFLEAHGSVLATYRVEAGEETQSAAEVIMLASIASDYGVSPKVLLAMLEAISGLVTDQTSDEETLALAMGIQDPQFAGFRQQVNAAAAAVGRAYERHYFDAQPEERHLAASRALDDFAGSLGPTSVVGRRVEELPDLIAQTFTALFGAYDALAQLDVGDLDEEMLQFLDKPFDKAPADYPRVTSFFDHQYPDYELTYADGTVTLFTGSTEAGYSYPGHPGVDYDENWGEDILAAADGTIAAAGERTGDPNETCLRGYRDGEEDWNTYARFVAVDHDLNKDGDPDFRTLYWHLSNYDNPATGQPWEADGTEKVAAGAKIGEAGNTGNVMPCPSDEYDHDSGSHLHFEVRADPATTNPYSGPSKMDPFGWWDSQRPDPVPGLPTCDYESVWLWSSSDLVDDQDDSFEKFLSTWEIVESASAYHGKAWRSRSRDAWAVWALKAPFDGRYYLDVFVPDLPDLTDTAQYQYYVIPDAPVRFIVDQAETRGEWVRISGGDNKTIELLKGQMVLVKLRVQSIDKDTIFDAVRLYPYPVDLGLRYLREHQNPDGGWGEYGSSTGITGLATLAFLNYGMGENDLTDTDGDGTPDIEEAMRFLIDHYDAVSGRFWGDVPHGEPAYTYDTSIGILVLIAADRAAGSRDYADEIAAARDYLLSIQSVELNGYFPSNINYGGWGYPRTDWSDLSNTQWAVMALDAAYDYLDQDMPDCTDPSTWTGKVVHYADALQLPDGGFDYRQNWFYQSVGSMTHAGIWTNLLAGRAVTSDQVAAALDWVQTGSNWSVTENPNRGSAALYYYYTTAAKSLAMSRKTALTINDVSRDWFRELLLELTSGSHAQQADGHWYNTNTDDWEGDENLTTAYAILALETRTLPPNVPLSLSIILHSPADLHLFDSTGRHVGLNYDTGGVDLEVPGSLYSAGETQVITLTVVEAGNYTVQLIGTASGEYHLDILARQNGELVDTDTFSGTIGPGEAQGSFLTVGGVEGALTVLCSDPAPIPVMRVQPSKLSFDALPGDILTATLVVAEETNQHDIEGIGIFGSDLLETSGNVIPGYEVLIEPHYFSLAAGASRTVTVTMALDPALPRGQYNGDITVESLNAGAKAVSVQVNMLVQYLPLIAR